MQIDSPEQLMGAIKLLMVQMNRGQRKQFHKWIKDKLNAYNFQYPEGMKLKETDINEKPTEVASSPAVLSVPDTRLVDASGTAIEGSGVRDIVPSDERGTDSPSQLPV